MKRRAWPAVAVAMGLLSTSTWGGDAWVASVQPASAPVVKAKLPTAAETVWKSSGATKIEAVPSGEWAPSGAKPIAKGEIEWRASAAIVQASFVQIDPIPQVEVQIIPSPGGSSLPEVAPLPATPAPRLVDPLTVTKQVPKEVAPPPLPVPMPERPKVSPMLTALKPQPAPAPTLVAPKTVVVTTDESTAVWGSYSSSTKPVPTTLPGTTIATTPADAPVRHGTYGSPSLHLSRDYHFLDACSKALLGEDEQQILAEKPYEPSNCFVSAEYLVWWVNNGNIPVLASTASSSMFGYLGNPSTNVLLGPGSFGDSSPRTGLRLRAGNWFDDCHNCGIDASFFFLGTQTNSVAFGSDQNPIIARPFYAPNFGREFAELVAFPGLSTGSLVVENKSFLWGADVNLRRGQECSPCEWFVGFRNVNLNKTLTITEFITAGANAPDPAGTRIVVRDQFEVRNSFYGGQVGGASSKRYGNFSFEARGSVAMGVTHQVLTIEGNQSRTRPGQPTENFTGGLLAVGPNLGTFEKNQFSVVPEATLALGYYVRPGLKAFMGYNFIGWTNVLRPGDAIDRVVDLTFVPNAPNVPFSGQPRPQPQFKQSDLVIQGITFGLEGTW